MKGSYLDNDCIPRIGNNVWYLDGGEQLFGTVINMFNLDCGIGYVSCDIVTTNDERVYHCMLNTVFDHCPVQVVINDYFGRVTVWE